MFKPVIKKKNWVIRLLTKKSIRGICLAPFGIYLREDVYKDMNEVTINHEYIHWQQQIELLIVFFYVFYILLFVFYGYRNNPFEKESYKNDKNQEYLKNRKLFSWIKYFR